MERTEVSKSLNLIWHPHPISAIADREVQAFVFTPGLSVRQLLLKSGIDPIQPIYVVLDDKLLTVKQWDTVYPEEGQILNVQATIQGGDGGGGSNTGQIIAMVAVIAIAIAAPYALSYFGVVAPGTLVAAGGGLTMAGSLLSAGIMVAGSLLVGAIFAPKTNTGLDSVSSTQQESPTYSLSGGNNRLRPYESMPVVMGQHRFFPDAGMKPYTEYLDNDQYLYQVFHFGISGLYLTDFKIGTTPITSFTDYEFRYNNSEGKFDNFPGNVDSIAGAVLTKSGGAVTRTTSSDTYKIGIDIEATLFYANNSGGMDSRTVEFVVEYRPVGSFTWLQPNMTTSNSSAVAGSFVTETYTEEVGYWESYTDYLGYSQSYWVPDVVTKSRTVYKTGSGGIVQITGNSQKAIRTTFQFDVAAGEYEVRITRNTNDSTDSREQTATNWSVLKSYQLDNGDYTGQGRQGLVIKATEQLNGAIQQLSCVANAVCLYWNGSAWVSGQTSNPAHWFMDFAMGRRDTNGKLLYGIGMAASQLDLPALHTWAQFCDTEGLTFNAVIDGSQTAADLLMSIARCGFGSPSWASGKLGIVYDARQATPVAAFGMSNIIKDTFAVTYITEELADEIVVRYVDPDNEWNQSEVRVVVPGVTTPVRTSSIDVFGCTNTAMAGKFANYLAAQQYYRRRRISWETDFQGFVCNRGDVVLLSHDLTQWAYSGRFVSVDGDTVSIDRHVPRNGSEEYLMLVRPDGSTTVYTVEAALQDQDTLTLTTPIVLQEGYLPMDHMWFFSPLATPGKKVKILSVSPASESRVRITATDEYDEFYDAWDGTFIQPTIDTLLPSVPVAVTNLTLNNRVAIESGYRVNRVGANWKVSGSSQYSIVKVYFDGNLVLEQAENLTGSVELDISAAGTVRVDVTPVGITGLGATATSTLEIGELDAPQPPASMELTYGEDGKSATFTWPQVIGAQSYVVEIVVSGTVKRQLNVGNTRSYEYTFEQAAVDGGPFRSYTARVYSVANDIQSETYASASFSNPQIGQLQNASIEPMPNSLWFKCDKPSDADFSGIQLWVSTNSAFTPSSDTLVYDGTDTFVTVSADKNGNPLESGVTYYLYAAGYDVFGKDNIALTAKLSASILSPAWGLLEGDIETSMIESGLRDRIDLIDVTPAENIDALNINNGLISKIRTNATDLSTVSDSVNDIGEKLLESALKIQGNTDLLYDAGLTIDSNTGEVYIFGVKENANELSEVGIRLSAAEGNINLKASYTYVDEAIVNAVIDPSQIAELGALTARVSTAELDIDALESEITLKATNADLENLDLRVGSAEIAISGLEGSVALKANTTDLDNLGLRVTDAETTLSTINGAEINQTVQDVRYINKQQDVDSETLLRNVLQGEFNKDFSIESIAHASSNLKSYTDEGILAEASARLQLAAALDNTNASIVNESIARATADAAEASARQALAVRVTDVETGLVTTAAAVVNESNARADADEALADSISVVSARFNNFDEGETIESFVSDYAYSKSGTNGAIASSQNYVVARIQSTTTKSFWQSTAPTRRGVDTETSDDIPLVIGDSWYDTDDSNRLYRWTGTAWTIASDSSALSDWIVDTYEGDIDDIQGQVDAKAESWFQDADPATAWTTDDLKLQHNGDLWYSATTNLLKRYSRTGINTGEWTTIEDATAIAAAEAASNAQDTADGKIITFAQASQPTAEAIGDLWIETDNKNKLYRWNGTSWVGLRDGTIADVDARVTTVETAKIGYATKGGIVFDNNGAITDKSGVDAWNAANPSDLAVWNQGIPFATAVKQVSISDGTESLILEERFEAQKNTNDSIQGKYSVKVDNNGYVSGFGLISTANNETPTSEFNIIADKFALAPVATDHSAVDGSPFFVLTSSTVIDGVTIPAGTYMKKAFIHDATITTAKITDLAVDTIKIKGNAVTVPQTFSSSGDVNNFNSNWKDVITGTITPSGFQQIVVMMSLGAAGANFSLPLGGTQNLYGCGPGFRVLITNMDGTISYRSDTPEHRYSIMPDNFMQHFSGIFMLSAIGNGSTTYKVRLQARVADAGVTELDVGDPLPSGIYGMFCRSPRIIVLETKR